MHYDEKKDVDKRDPNKRKEYISWDQYFMGIAHISRLRSKDPRTQVGAVIVRDNKIISIGYNGFPNGISDDVFSWASEAEQLKDRKDAYVVHAELNAILNTDVNLKGAILYVTLFPCNECAKAIIQSGIKEVIYDEYRESEKSSIALSMFDHAGIIARKFVENNDIKIKIITERNSEK